MIVKSVLKSRRGPMCSERWPGQRIDTEGILSSLAAILVLFTTMLDPRISVGMAVAFLLGLGIYHFVRKN